MISAFRSWFDCGDHADVLLRFCIQSEPSETASEISVSASRKRPRDEEEGVDASAAAPDAATKEPSSSAINSSAQPAEKALQQVQQVQQARAYSLHAVLLAGQFAWFKAVLSKPWQQPACTVQHDDTTTPNSPASAIRHELTVHVQHDEADGMDLLLRLIYGYDLPALTTDTVSLLFTCLQLADRFDSRYCVEMLIGHIKDVSLDVSMVRHVYQVPPGVKCNPKYQQLLGTCKCSVLKMYGSVPSVIRDKQLRREFCSLPFAAVLAWAESDELKVQSENCVVYLLSAWVQAAQGEGGQGVSDEELEELVQQVRVLHLGPAYLHHVLPRLSWFESCESMVYLPSLLSLWCWHACDKAAFDQAGINDDDDDTWEGPKQWVAKPRKQYVMTDADTTLKWEVGSEELQQLYDGRGFSSPTTMYINGLHMCLLLEPCSQSSAGPPAAIAGTLSLYMHVHESQLAGAISDWPDMATVILGPVTFRVMGGPKKKIMPSAWVGTASHGVRDLLERSAPTMRELLAPYLRDGKLQVEAQFSYLDLPSAPRRTF